MDQLLKTCNGLQTMRFKTNHHIGLMAQNLETMTLRVMVMHLLMMLLRQSFNIPALKTWQQVKNQQETMHLRNSLQKLA